MTDPQDNNARPLGSAEYRAKLMTKLNCLIAVLEVAIAKVQRSMELPGANEERLLRIKSNLENTLEICGRAKGTLEDAISQQPTATAIRSKHRDRDGMSARDYVELSSIEEYRKFKELPPIKTTDIESLDLEDLAKKLGEI